MQRYYQLNTYQQECKLSDCSYLKVQPLYFPDEWAITLLRDREICKNDRTGRREVIFNGKDCSVACDKMEM